MRSTNSVVESEIKSICDGGGKKPGRDGRSSSSSDSGRSASDGGIRGSAAVRVMNRVRWCRCIFTIDHAGATKRQDVFETGKKDIDLQTQSPGAQKTRGRDT